MVQADSDRRCSSLVEGSWCSPVGEEQGPAEPQAQWELCVPCIWLGNGTVLGLLGPLGYNGVGGTQG